MKIRYQNQRGSAILLTLVLVLMASAIAALSINRASTDVSLSFNTIRKDKALLMAAAGAHRAVTVLNADRTVSRSPRNGRPRKSQGLAG